MRSSLTALTDLGALLRRTLPKHHLNEHAKDVVRLGVGLTATIAAALATLMVFTWVWFADDPRSKGTGLQLERTDARARRR